MKTKAFTMWTGVRLRGLQDSYVSQTLGRPMLDPYEPSSGCILDSCGTTVCYFHRWIEGGFISMLWPTENGYEMGRKAA